MVNASRGNRGEQINYETGLVLAESLRRFSVQRLIITASRDCTGSKDAVSLAEEWAFLRALRESKMDCVFYPDLAIAIRDALEYTGAGDPLLLGAQGMDAGAEMVMTYLSAQGTSHSRRDLQYSG
ncbi:MAG: UDP-N-acetylmuramoyl-L-alanyl-D-glutamate--2,6-diaminopimelate ligase [Eubacteriales bacterium]|nr:UDP-N-acetylmuramoyl-L-alanyl-D-glutamate--2,6-diaminopimelate ligase [Eubacteriales bacterium]